MSSGEIILVAGVDYPKYKPKNEKDKSLDAKFDLHAFKPGPWRSFCELVAKRILKTDDKLRVTLFDFSKGAREILTLNKIGKLAFTTEDASYGQLTPENYRRADIIIDKFVPPTPQVTRRQGTKIGYFPGIGELGDSVGLNEIYNAFYTGVDAKPPYDTSLSIVDVYEYIKQAGAAREHQLKELHLFSHGWAGGPILVNTQDFYKLADDKEPERDPYDKDGRAEKDFLKVNLEVDEFAKAFASGATSYVWGCDAFHLMKKLIMVTGEKKRTIKDLYAPKLEFTWTGDWEDEAQFHQLLGGKGTHHSAPISINGVVEKVRWVLNVSYMQSLAAASKNRVIGPLPGTYSTFDGSDNFGEKLLHIPMGPKFGDDEGENFQAVLRFYEEMLSINFDRKNEYSPKYGRGYAIYEP